MSFMQKEIVEEILNRNKKTEREVAELRRLSAMFLENEKTRKAKDVVQGESLAELRGRFSDFFNTKPKEVVV